jgi:CBS domain-containing protein
MIPVKKLLEGKASKSICTITPNHTVIDALALMAARNIGAVIVLDGDRLVGMFSERDYARKGILQGRKAKSTPIAEVMLCELVTVTPDMDIEDCMTLMTAHRTRHLPVVQDERVIGVLSIGDIVHAMLQDQSEHISFLEHYITGR